MKYLLFILTCLGMLIYACDSGKHSRVDSTSRLVPEPDIIERLKYQKTFIDTLFNQRDSAEFFVKLPGKNQLVPFKDSVLPDETETSFSIIRDSLRHIVAITESPYSQSGDWYITLTHYFDKAGETFAFQRQSNFFNSGCTDRVAYETKTEFYNGDFKLIAKEYELVDEKGKSLKNDSCAFLYEYFYKVLPTVDKYLKANGILINTR